MRRHRVGILILCAHAALIAVYHVRQPTRPATPVSAVAARPLAPAISPLRHRLKFVRRLGEVQEGMPRSQVRKLLGPPDDRWVGEEVNAWGSSSVEGAEGTEAWTYGGDGHLTFPTLGKVTFDARGRVVAIVGQRQAPPITPDTAATAGEVPLVRELPPGLALPPEPETRRILRLIDRLHGYDSETNPLRVIQVVNALQPLGKVSALEVIDEYLRLNTGFRSPCGELFVVLRCLFEVPQPLGYSPRTSVWTSIPSETLRRSPRFPVILYQDLPFLASHDYALTDIADPEGRQLEPYRESGLVRLQPLRPPDNPLTVIDDLAAFPEWPDWNSEGSQAKIAAREQVLQLVEPVYRVAKGPDGARLTGDPPEQDKQWRAHVRRFAALNVRWDPALNTYVRPGVRPSPERAEPYSYPRAWLPNTRAGKVPVTVQRRDSKSINVWLLEGYAESPLPRLRIFVDGKESGTGVEFSTRGMSATYLDLDAGKAVRLVLEQNREVLAETVLRP